MENLIKSKFAEKSWFIRLYFYCKGIAWFVIKEYDGY